MEVRTRRSRVTSGTDAQSWLNLQSAYDLRVAEIAVGRIIERNVKPRAA